MRERFERFLGNVTARLVAGGAECLIAVARRALDRLLLRIHAVRKPVIEVVDFRQRDFLSAIDRGETRRVLGYEIAAGKVDVHQI